MTLNYAYILIAFVVSLLFSLIGTPLIVKMCNMNGIYDLPSARKVHKQAIPRLGGSLFMPSLSVGVAVAIFLMHQGMKGNFHVGLST
ncbi:MAG: undecaprenyl/decaprenyl-phosphate alpha-N-acetylglucosaminyl 1-phosphate transferase, partial [Bacteroidaceae bacterium]|nr:undecaprenyl/decaprenyl-phosphate alpha-N-acetylglucosaminyl 1-phosphate transferase [Bacteroidaceae bacterium]